MQTVLNIFCYAVIFGCCCVLLGIAAWIICTEWQWASEELREEASVADHKQGCDPKNG